MVLIIIIFQINYVMISNTKDNSFSLSDSDEDNYKMVFEREIFVGKTSIMNPFITTDFKEDIM